MQQEIISTPIQEEKKKKSVLFYINIFLFISVLALGTYILFKEKFWIKEQEQEVQETKEKTEEKKGDGSVVVEVKETEYTDFTGEFVKAQLPEGWSIKEYKDGDGTEYLVDGINVKGLTGLEIKKDENIIFKLEAVDGYGVIDCGELAHFKDFSKEYEEKWMRGDREIGEETKILDFSNTAYSEAILFGTKIRRVGKTFYYDTVEEGPYFESHCTRLILVFKDLVFTVGKGSNQSKHSDYQYTLSEDVSEDNLLLLDGILKSMKVK